MKPAITIEGFDLERHVFSGGEVQVRLKRLKQTALDRSVLGAAVITAHVRSSDDLMALLLATDALRRAGYDHLRLRLPYLPYARQDRVCAPGEALSLRVMCDLINAQRYSVVEVWDVHSDVAMALLDRAVNIDCSRFLQWLSDWGQQNWSNTTLVAPDAGAIKKVAAAAKHLGVPFVRADKTRDATTGEITGTVVYSEHIGAKDFLIVDDICDGGRTFTELARQLRPLTDGRVMLYVTHGIFSRGTAVFDGLIDRVFVANSFVDPLPANFQLIEA